MKRFLLFVFSILFTFSFAIAQNSTNISSCDSYTWPVNGNTYTQSGVYSANTINDYSMSFGGPNSGNVVSFNNQVIPTNGSFTISFWAKPTSGNLMHQNTWSSGNAFYIGLTGGCNGSELRCGDTWQNTGACVTTNTWQYISIVRHYNSHVEIYIDGIIMATKSTDITINAGYRVTAADGSNDRLSLETSDSLTD